MCGVLGCSAEIEQFSTDAESGSTHALVSVERSTSIDGATTRADAFAGFVRVPADVESRPLFELLGLVSALPQPGQCRERSANPNATLSTIGHVELLEAGEVVVGVGDSETSLAPHAFPSVTDAISGVLYTTRDRSSTGLPAGARYVVRTSGGAGISGIAVGGDAPNELDAVQVNGRPLAEVTEVSTGRPIDLTWGPGTGNDLLYVELSSNEGKVSTICTFRDDAGAGSVAGAAFNGAGSGRLSLHRVRTAAFTSPGVDVGEVTFDFELAADVSFSR
jgi:hypothetical protein